MIRQDTPVTDDIVTPNQRAALANLQLARLESSDVLIKLDNGLLAAEITASLQQHLSQSSEFDFQNIKVKFKPQFIQLTTQLKVRDDAGNVLQAVATGEVKLEVSGDRLEWFPAYEQFKVTSSDFTFDQEIYAESVPQLDQQLLMRLNAQLIRSLREDPFNLINLQPVPLGEVEVGARLVSFDNATSVQSAALNGEFFVTGSAVLIEETMTSILLDLSFVPDLAVCPADIRVSRAVFSREIEAREPVDITGNLDSVENMHFFYSEISGASRPMTIIHYWFADGQPVAVKELAVGPSQRWRTWSAREDAIESATHWRVLVVEKESGCILHSKSIRTLDTDNPVTVVNSDLPLDVFAHYLAAFNHKTADFPSHESGQGKVSMHVRREYIGQVFQSAISDLQIETAFDQTDLSATQYASDLLPFDVKDIVCEDQKCSNPLVCSVNVAHCKRLRDTRECSSCLFHNPLNNRCLHTAEDPICVAAKNRQNTIYQQDREACIAAAENSRNDCQQLSAQIAQSCEIETRVEKSACEASKAEINSMKPGSVLARVSADSHVIGQLSMLFSNFKISGDFLQLQQNVTLKSNINIKGQLDFEPDNTDWLLSNCINAWSGPFNNRAISSTPLNSMLTTLDSDDDVFTATWSGIVLPLKMTSSPLESAFVSNPQLLAGCSLGLTVGKVEQAIVGQNADFFTGSLNLIIQPLPTKMKLSSARIQLANQVYVGAAKISEDFVSYELKPAENE